MISSPVPDSTIPRARIFVDTCINIIIKGNPVDFSAFDLIDKLRQRKFGRARQRIEEHDGEHEDDDDSE